EIESWRSEEVLVHASFDGGHVGNGLVRIDGIDLAAHIIGEGCRIAVSEHEQSRGESAKGVWDVEFGRDFGAGIPVDRISHYADDLERINLRFEGRGAQVRNTYDLSQRISRRKISLNKRLVDQHERAAANHFGCGKEATAKQRNAFHARVLLA